MIDEFRFEVDGAFDSLPVNLIREPWQLIRSPLSVEDHDRRSDRSLGAPKMGI